MSIDPSTISFPAQFVELAESLVRARQGDVAQIHARCGLDITALQHAEAGISLAQFSTLLHIILEHVLPGEPRSIQVLRHMPVTSHGLIGMVAMTSDTLGEALNVGLRYCPLIFPVIELYREDIGKKTHVHIRHHHDFGSPYNELLTEIVAGSFCKMTAFARFSSMSGAHSEPTGMEVQLTHASTEDPEAFLAFFGLPVKFGCQENQFIISRHTLSQPLLTRNRISHMTLETILAQRLQTLSQTGVVTQRVRRLLSTALTQGRLPAAPEIAAGMALSARTLSRRLGEEGSSLIALIHEVRMERAEMLLISTDLPLSQIAKQLGYSDIATFSRAFKRAKGNPPSKLRTHPHTPR